MPITSSTVLRNFRRAKNKNGKSLFVPKAMDNFLVWNLPDDYSFLEANPEVAEQVLFEVAEGKTVTKASEAMNIPFSLILDHARLNEEFGQRLEMARRFRAEGYHDKFENIADEVTEGTSKSAKVRAEIYRHLMTVGDRDRFSPQTKSIQESTSTVTFVVDTGIRRVAENPPIPTEGRTIGEAEITGEDPDGLPAPASPASDPLSPQEV